MQEKQLIKYIKGELNIPEKREVLNWIRNNQENQKKYNILKAKYVAAKLKDIEDVDVDVHFKKFNKKVRDKKKVNYISYSTAIVMIIALSIVFSNNYFGKSKETLKEKIPATIENSLVDDSFIETVTSKGDNEEVILSDGSKIILNVDSKLIYPKKFNDSIREVTLIGEAFFDIERDVNKPFIVNANEIKIKVLGTSFNVKSYSKDEKIETTLVTGKVELIKDQDNTPVELSPSQKAVFYKTKNKIKIEEVDSSNIIAWKEGKLIFQKASMNEVIIDLERKYNVKFIINSQKLLNYEYTGTFDNLSIDEVLELLAISSPIKYSIKDERIILEMK